jgi:hypothetical protein
MTPETADVMKRGREALKEALEVCEQVAQNVNLTSEQRERLNQARFRLENLLDKWVKSP